MLVAPVLWSLGGVLTRQIEAPNPLELAFWRGLFCALFVAAALLAFRTGNPLATIRKAGRAGLISGLMWGLMFTVFIVALTLTTVANVLVMCALGPLCTALLALVVLREPIPSPTWIAIVAAAIGMGAMFGAGFSADEPRHIWGTLLALAIPVAAAINVVVLRKAGAHLDLMPAILLGAVLCMAASLPWAMPFKVSASDLGWLATLGVFQVGLPCMLLVLAARTLSAPEIALLGLLEVVLGPLWAWLGAGEVPGGATLAGGAVVLAALAGNEFALAARMRASLK